MDRTAAAHEIKRRYADYLQPAKKKNTYICPLCGNGTGSTGDGMAIDPHGDKLHLKCFKCGFFGDLIELYQQEHGTTQGEAFRALYSRFNIAVDGAEPPQYARQETAHKAPEKPAERRTEPDNTAYYKACADRLTDPAAVQYLLYRHISPDTAARYGLGFDPEADPAGSGYPCPRLIMPTSAGHYVGRSIDPETPAAFAKLNNKGGRPGIFNAAALYADSAAPLFITEGIFDALSVIEAGGAAIALCSAGNRRELIEHLQERPTARRLIIAFDNDTDPDTRGAIERDAQELKSGIQGNAGGIFIADICAGSKDPNAALCENLEGFKMAIEKAILTAAAKPGALAVDYFLQAAQSDLYKPIKTGFVPFDKITGGGLTRQTLVMLGAAPAMGKTTLATQILEGMTERGADVIYINLEMSAGQLIAKALCRYAHKHGKGELTTAQIMRGYEWTQETKEAVYAAAEGYKRDIAGRFEYADRETAGADLAGILSFIGGKANAAKAAGRTAPIVCIDYLHLVSAKDDTGRTITDAQTTIKAVVHAFKAFAIENNTAVIAILANGRESNKAGKMTMESGRDSSNIEYSADLFLGLNFTEWENGGSSTDAEQQRAQKLRKITLKVLKNRMGIDGAKMDLLFDTAHGEFLAAAPEWRGK